MTKRGIIQLGAGIVRVSRPGVDVDSAGPLDFLLHEDDLYTQPYFAQFIVCPFAGDTALVAQTADVSVTIPDVSDDPIVILYPRWNMGGNFNYYPWGDASSTGGQVPNMGARYIVISSTQIVIRFAKNAIPWAPDGAYLILLRRPA